MKKMLSMLLCAVLLLGMGTAARSEVDFKNPPSGYYLTPADYPNTDLSKPYEIQMYTTSTATKDEQLVLNELNRILEERGFNTSVNYIHIVSNSTANMYSLTLSSGEVADIYFTAPWNYMWTEAAKGSWTVLDPTWIETYMPTTAKTQKSESWSETTINGEIIAIPGNAMNSNAKYPIVRQDLMEKYGFDTLTSWEDYMNFALTIAQKETPASGIFALNASANNIEVWRTYIQQKNMYPLYNDMFFYECKGADVLPAFEDVKLYYETDLFRAFCHDMKTLRDAGAWSQTALTNTTAAYDSFANLTGASFFWNGSVFTYGERAEKADPTVRTQAYDLFPEAFCIPEAYSNNNLTIPVASANPERAAMVIDLLKNDFQIGMLFRNGIQGVHWTDNGDMTFSKTERSADSNMGSISWALKTDWTYKEKEVTDIALRSRAMYDVQDQRIVPNPTVTFIFDDSRVKNHVAAVAAVANECRPVLELGMADGDVDAYLDEFISRMYDSGLGTIYDELGKQYNQWKATR